MLPSSISISLGNMESFMSLGFVGILRESLKIFCKNGKLMASLALLTIRLYSMFLSNVFSIKPCITDMLIKQSLLPVTDPKSPEFFVLLIGLKEDIRAFVRLEWIYVVISTVVSLFFATATIIAAAMIHSGRNLSFKELLLSTGTSLKRPFFAWFYATLLVYGYILLVLANLLPMVLVVKNPIPSVVLAIILVILASVLYTYLAVFWILAFVISVSEEKSGVQELGKAAQIVKGMRLHGFLLNLVFTILTFVIYQGIRLMTVKQSAAVPVIVGLVVINLFFLVKILLFVAYTIFYYQCKKTHGEEIELQWNSGNTKVPLLYESIP